MWSKHKLKFVRSLQQKKGREAERAFLAEGYKLVTELSARFHCRLVAATSSFLASHTLPDGFCPDVLTDRELEQASCLTTPQGLLAVFDMPADEEVFLPRQGELVLALDGVQDPGNVGTILRIADWFGIGHVVCSRDTADVFSPKVVQATMGALARVSVVRTSLPAWLEQLPTDCPIIGTFMEGENLYSAALPAGGVIVMGNEGNGISPAVATHISQRLHIPNFPPQRPTVESLNVAMATAITVAEFRRRVLTLPQ